MLRTINFNKAANRVRTVVYALTNKKLEEIDQYVGKDNIKVNNNYLSVGNIIKHAVMMKHINYKSLSPSDIALVHLTLHISSHNYLNESRPALRKIDKTFKNPCNAEECYWNSKNYQRKASKFNEKTGYELISVMQAQYLLSRSQPDIFEALFYNTKMHIRWGEKGLDTGNDDHTIFKLDAKLVLLYDGTEYPISSVKFAPYAGPKKIKTDRSKLLIEAKTIYDKVMGLNVNEKNTALLKIVNIQIMGLEAHAMSQYTLNTTYIIKQTLNDKGKKSMKRKLQEGIGYDEVAPSIKAKLIPIWRSKAKS
ncbi:hypothetical protein G6F46_000830 [Rhizopus delemar]|uniref:Uncharacterized protein n=2 Tax=Rhizopus TaxID=4842 RepID=A0A9P7CLU3_9FUNG|nr:hypothetical protein G6F36_010884 [Rhizopus arrhizus]KAG1455500.1 hypothetical protein G6F55_007033 [Rhizopus delemar]KAG1505045.1 hypothetical protein G6F54_000586 [Rhizopus delemar]KAG1513380.1 hypothetical protein G6F53_004482 [Rhizopus delemar]KAG1522399.1 hypothetical protein G6F52_005891 [Rhizopus delemar]